MTKFLNVNFQTIHNKLLQLGKASITNVDDIARFMAVFLNFSIIIHQPAEVILGMEFHMNISVMYLTI